MSSYSIRSEAVVDLENIWLYSYDEWGPLQADSYLDALLSRLDWLSNSPMIGKKRDNIKQGYYCFPEGMHFIFYTIFEDNIDIIGVPHQSMDIHSHLSNE